MTPACQSRRRPRSPAHLGLALAGALAALAGCDRSSGGASAPTVAVSNSYLEAAVGEFVGPAFGVARLAEPGSCPGHFDLRPSQLKTLRNCRLLLRFDFQADLDSKLSAVAAERLLISAVTVPGGLCEPTSYLATCRQVADALVAAGLLTPAQANERLPTIEKRLQELGHWAQRRIHQVGLAGAPVVSSRHQAAFCTFLRLKVAGTFSGADTASIEEISAAIGAGRTARAVIANLPEGRGLADALGARLVLPVVVLHNFPDQANHQGRFDAMLRDNVERLAAIASP